MFAAIRRKLGLHVHEWELVDSRVEEVEVAMMPRLDPRYARAGAGNTPPTATVPVEILTFRCKTCGKQRESHSGGGLP